MSSIDTVVLNEAVQQEAFSIFPMDGIWVDPANTWNNQFTFPSEKQGFKPLDFLSPSVGDGGYFLDADLFVPSNESGFVPNTIIPPIWEMIPPNTDFPYIFGGFDNGSNSPISLVPEPSILSLLLLGSVILVVLARIKKKELPQVCLR